MKIGYAILLNNECHNFIRQIQLELHDQFGFRLSRQAPHITVKSPFDTDDLNPFADYLERLAREVKPFEIIFDGFNYFTDQVLYLEVVENQQLTDLHWRILHDLKSDFGLEAHDLEGKRMKFHASIAGFGHRAEYEWTREYLQKYQPKFRFTADTFGLFYYLDEGSGWIVNRRVRFGD